jgi:hypothetical protein
MKKNIFKKFLFKYRTTDIRLKLRYLKKITGINFYPNYFSKSGLSSIYTRIVFFLIIFEKFVVDFKIKYKILFNTEYDFKKIKFINTFPRSGTTFLRNILSSYYELKFNNGDGVPKYDKSKDKFFYNVFHEKNLIPMNIFKLIHQYSDLNEFRNYWIKKNNYDYDNFYISHYPISKDDLIPNRSKKKQTFLIRTPIDACISYIKHSLNFETYIKNKKEKYDRNKLDKLLDKSVNDYKLFLSYLLSIKSKSKVIKFEDLVNSSEKTLINIFNFYNIKYDKKILKKSILINKKNNFKKLIYSGSKNTNRISNYKIKSKDLLYLKKALKNKLSNEIIEFNDL